MHSRFQTLLRGLLENIGVPLLLSFIAFLSPNFLKSFEGEH